jgi:hypothetical protein
MGKRSLRVSLLSECSLSGEIWPLCVLITISPTLGRVLVRIATHLHFFLLANFNRHFQFGARLSFVPFFFTPRDGGEHKEAEDSYACRISIKSITIRLNDVSLFLRLIRFRIRAETDNDLNVSR